jgi:acyl-phosphate glycerol 3-phosphate acyltransferase
MTLPAAVTLPTAVTLLTLAMLIAGYLLGSIPSGYLAGRWLAGLDIRREGSGSTGATNVLRVVGKGPALAVFLVDVLKGAAAVLLAKALLQPPGAPLLGTGTSVTDTGVVAAGLAALAGHIWPIWLNWKGGKAVATGLGDLVLAAVPHGGSSAAAAAAAPRPWATEPRVAVAGEDPALTAYAALAIVPGPQRLLALSYTCMLHTFVVPAAGESPLLAPHGPPLDLRRLFSCTAAMAASPRHHLLFIGGTPRQAAAPNIRCMRMTNEAPWLEPFDLQLAPSDGHAICHLACSADGQHLAALDTNDRITV